MQLTRSLCRFGWILTRLLCGLIYEIQRWGLREPQTLSIRLLLSISRPTLFSLQRMCEISQMCCDLSSMGLYTHAQTCVSQVIWMSVHREERGWEEDGSTPGTTLRTWLMNNESRSLGSSSTSSAESSRPPLPPSPLPSAASTQNAFAPGPATAATEEAESRSERPVRLALLFPPSLSSPSLPHSPPGGRSLPPRSTSRLDSSVLRAQMTVVL